MNKIREEIKVAKTGLSGCVDKLMRVNFREPKNREPVVSLPCQHYELVHNCLSLFIAAMAAEQLQKYLHY